MANNTSTKNKKTNATKSKSTSKKATTTKKRVDSTPKKSTIKPKTENISTIKIEKKEGIKNQEKETNVILTIIGIIVLVIVAIVIFRLTYAFFSANIKDNNPDNIDTQVVTANLLVRYEDDNKVLITKIVPGDVISKEFRVINDEESNDVGYFTIALQNLENTFSVVCPTEDAPNNGELVFTLKKLDGIGGNEIATLSTGTLPCVTPAMSDDNPFIIYTQDSVQVKSTNYYKLSIEYKNLNLDQSANMDNGKLNAKINIIESESENRTQGSVYSK